MSSGVRTPLFTGIMEFRCVRNAIMTLTWREGGGRKCIRAEANNYLPVQHAGCEVVRFESR